MRRRLVSVILFALVAAAASSTLIFKIISARTQNTVQAATAKVVVATRDLSPGDLIGAADVREIEWPTSAGTQQWIRRSEDAVGRGLLTAVSREEPFAESRLAPKGAGAGLASRIPPGMRAIAVHVDELSGLSRFILAGMHVDVISTGASGGQNGPGMITRTILQNIEVFSTGQNVEPDAKNKPSAVQSFHLLVTPQQAEVLSQAVAQTRIELVLRNPLDKANFSSSPPAPAIMLTDTALPRRVQQRIVKPPEHEKAPLPTAALAAPTVEVIHGSKKTINIVAAATGPETKQ